MNISVLIPCIIAIGHCRRVQNSAETRLHLKSGRSSAVSKIWSQSDRYPILKYTHKGFHPTPRRGRPRRGRGGGHGGRGGGRKRGAGRAQMGSRLRSRKTCLGATTMIWTLMTSAVTIRGGCHDGPRLGYGWMGLWWGGSAERRETDGVQARATPIVIHNA